MSILSVPAPWDTVVTRSLWAIGDVLRLPSVDLGGQDTVRDAIGRRDVTSDRYRAIAAEMREDGINAVPVLVIPACAIWWRPLCDALDGTDRPVFASGHHRVKCALEAGLPRILVTDHVSDAAGVVTAGVAWKPGQFDPLYEALAAGQE